MQTTTTEERVEQLRSCLDSLPFNSWVAYTDGSCIKNPGPCGMGIYILYRWTWKTPEEFAIPLGAGTNNYAELKAIEWTIDRFISTPDLRLFPPEAIRIFTDSKYAINMVTNGFISHVHPTLLDTIKRQWIILKEKCPNCELLYVPAHSKIFGNESADRLAFSAARISYSQQRARSLNN